MSLLRLGVTKPIAFFVFFSVFAVAQISAPNCTDTSYAWTFNSVGQSPCTVIAYMMGSCNGSQYALSPLQSGYKYHGPSGPDNSNLCECNTVGYSLFSSCVACQGETWITWSEWITNCSKTLPPGSFPNPVPSGIRVPQWAFLDVRNENRWNANKSYSVGDKPELAPGATLGPSTATVPPTSSAASSSTSPALVGHSSHTGAIAGGVAGGIAAISIIVAAVVLYLRRHPRESPAVFDGESASQPPMDDTSRPMSVGGAVASSSSSYRSPVMMKLYNPDDPTTFPPDVIGPPSPDMPPQGSTSPIGSISSLTAMQTPSRDPRGYHSFPMPGA